MNIFISLPMNGKSEEEILDKMNSIKLLYPNDTIIDTLITDAPEDAEPLWFLGESIKLMSKADIVYCCKEWSNYRGCKLEHACALAYGKHIVYE